MKKSIYSIVNQEVKKYLTQVKANYSSKSEYSKTRGWKLSRIGSIPVNLRALNIIHFLLIRGYWSFYIKTHITSLFPI